MTEARPLPEPQPHSELYVAIDLDTWEAPAPLQPDQDTICEPHGYRRLDPEYYAWLRKRMEGARDAVRTGRLAARQFQGLRERFNSLHTWALDRFGEPALYRAVAALDPTWYQPPRVHGFATVPPPATHLYPEAWPYPFVQLVTEGALATVDAVREQALALGWTEAGLYQNRGRLRFAGSDDYGVVCYVRPTDQVTGVTAQWIELTNARGSRGRVYNKAVSQPGARPLLRGSAAP